MHSKYGKRYFEEYAKLSLAECYDRSLNRLIKSESPDFYSDELSIGLEVVEAITEEESEQMAVIDEYFGRGLDGSYIKEEAGKRFPYIKGKIECIDHTAIYAEHNGCYDFKIHLMLLERSIENKTEKLNSIYKVYNHNWLYVFTATPLFTQNDIEEFLRNYRSDKKLQYNKVFVNCYDKIFIINSYTTVESIDVDKDTLQHLKNILEVKSHSWPEPIS